MYSEISLDFKAIVLKALLLLKKTKKTKTNFINPMHMRTVHELKLTKHEIINREKISNLAVNC